MNEHHHAAQLLLEARPALAEAAAARQFALRPELEQRYGPHGRTKCRQDAEYHLSYLGEAVAADQPALFDDYVGWAGTLLLSEAVAANDLAFNLRCLRDVLPEHLPADAAALVATFVDQGLQVLAREAASGPSFVQGGRPHAELAAHYLRALLDGDRHAALQLISDAAAAGVSVNELYMHVFQPCQYEIGRLWHLNHVSIAQEHFCTAVTQTIMGTLYPAIFSTPRIGRTAVIACVGSELHEMGARMVADILELNGWDTIYLGANTPAPGLAEMVVQRRADLLCLSATMTFHVRQVAATIVAVRAQEAGQRLPILVGGYPFRLTPNLWRQIGADGFAPDADAAVELANRLTQQ